MGLPRLLGLSALLVLGTLAALAAAGSAAPTVTILSPAEGATIDSGTVPLNLNITNITMNGSAIGMPAVPGEGHYHLYLDSVYIRPDFTLDTYLADVATGAHEIKVALAENDHTELNINATVNVTISSGAPRLKILSPAPSSAWNSSSVELRIWVENFTLDPAGVGQPPVAGTGHYHVLIDGAYFYYGATEFFNVTYLTPGSTYAIRVALYNNDHSSLAVPVFDEVRMTIAPGAPRLNLDFSLFQANVNASSVEESFTVSGFTINPNAIGQAAVVGEGHYHAWLDGAFLGPAAANPILLTNLSVGPHTLLVELRNNDHSPLSPRVVDFTVFTVLANSPRVTITSPADPSTVNASSVEVEFTIGNFTVSAAHIGLANVVGEGHWHLYVDGVYITFGADPVALVSDLTPGPHLIQIELHNNDHSDLTWPAFDILRVVVSANAPRVTITSPAASSTVNSSSVDLAFTIGNFTISPAHVGLANVVGEGHWHLYVDGVYIMFGTALTATATRLTPGMHAISIELHNNDHSDLTWPAFDVVWVTVPAGAPSVTITTPSAGSTIGLNFTALTVSTSNFTIVNKPGQTAVSGEGHYHIFLDGSSSIYDMAFAPTSLVKGLSPGMHTIRVMLVNNDHTPLTPTVVDEVQVTVVGNQPSITITAPASGADIYGSTVTVTVVVANFTLSAAHVGQAPVNGEGHWHVFVDGVYSGFSATTSIDVTGLTPGDHTLKVALFNNDHTALALEISASVVVHVAALPSISITSPTTGTETTETTITLTVTVTNFTLVTVGSTSVNAAGQGHYHVLLDGALSSMSSSPTVSVSGLTVGTHTIRVMLVNNDHSNITAGQNSSEITVTVKAAAPPAKGFLPGFGLLEAAAAFAAVATIAARRHKGRRA